MGLITPMDKFDSHGEEFPDWSLYTTEDLHTMQDMISDEINQRNQEELRQREDKYGWHSD